MQPAVVCVLCALLGFALCAPVMLEREASAWPWARVDSEAKEHLNLMPMPASLSWDGTGAYVRIASLDMGSLASFGSLGARQGRAVERFAARFANLSRPGTRNVNYQPFPDAHEWRDSQPASVKVSISAIAAAGVIDYPQLEDAEQYSLAISHDAIANVVTCNVTASTTTGALRAFATLLQLITMRPPFQDRYSGPFYLPVGFRCLEDKPFLRWRGGMVDVARHYHPVEDLKRILDGFEYYKLNVMHLHLCDDQGWRMPVPGWPRLVTVGGEGQYYTKQELQELVEYAADRAVRLYPEFDVPGHAGALLYAYPELCPHHFPTEPVHRWGIFNYVIDPTIDITYRFLSDLLAECRDIFKDRYFHLGGDEVQWPSFSPQQQTWMAAHNVTRVTIHGYFNNRSIGLINAAGFTAMGWQEISAQPLPPETVVHWWTFYNGASPYKGVNSAGYYFDHLGPAPQFWAQSLDSRLVGAEFCMWSEWAADNIDTRIFPSLMATAETFWLGTNRGLSSQGMEARLMVQELSSEEIGLAHRAVYRTQIKALAANVTAGQGAWQFAEAVQNIGGDTPQNDPVYDALYITGDRVNVGGPAYPNFEFVDATKPNSMLVTALRWLTQRALFERFGGPQTERLKELLRQWLAFDVTLRTANAFPRLVDIAQDVSSVMGAWLHWIEAVQAGAPNAESFRGLASSAGRRMYTLPPHNWAMSSSLKAVSASFTMQPVVATARPPVTTAPPPTTPTPTTRTTTPAPPTPPPCSGCSGHGSCNAQGVCQCTGGYHGLDCDQPPFCLTSDQPLFGCSNHGACNPVDGSCMCSGGYSGPACATNPLCVQSGCSGHGFCTASGACNCTGSWSGLTCALPPPCQCGPNGSCSPDSGVCQCRMGWSGPACDVAPLCVQSNCSGHGSCSDAGSCVCSSAYTGLLCETPVTAPPPPPSFTSPPLTSASLAPTPTARPGACAEFPSVPGTARGVYFSIVFQLPFDTFDCPALVTAFAQLWLRPQHVLRLQSVRAGSVIAAFHADDSGDASGTALQRYQELGAALSDPNSAESRRAAALGIPVLETLPKVTTQSASTARPSTAQSTTATTATTAAATTSTSTTAAVDGLWGVSRKTLLIAGVALLVVAGLVVGAVFLIRAIRKRRHRIMSAPVLANGETSVDAEHAVDVDAEASNDDLFDNL